MTAHRKRKSKKTRHIVEYIGLRLILLLVDYMPLSFVEALARGLADFWFFVGIPRRRIAINNIIQSGIATNPRDVRRLARASYRHFGMVIVESLKAGRFFTAETWQQNVKLDIDSETMALLKDPKQGIIVVSAHLGNFEVAGLLMSHLKPLVGVARKMNNPYVDRIMQKRMPTSRFRYTPKHDSDARRFLRILKNGEILAILADQHARQRGMMLDFFGRPASTHRSPALLHLISRAPICFGYCLRTGPMSYLIKLMPPLNHERTGDRESDTRMILEKLTRDLESAIRTAPEQYLWAHRRWREG